MRTSIHRHHSVLCHLHCTTILYFGCCYYIHKLDATTTLRITMLTCKCIRFVVNVFNSYKSTSCKRFFQRWCHHKIWHPCWITTIPANQVTRIGLSTLLTRRNAKTQPKLKRKNRRRNKRKPSNMCESSNKSFWMIITLCESCVLQFIGIILFCVICIAQQYYILVVVTTYTNLTRPPH